MTRSRDATRPSRASLSFGGGLAKSVSIGDDEDDEDVEPLQKLRASCLASYWALLVAPDSARVVSAIPLLFTFPAS